MIRARSALAKMVGRGKLYGRIRMMRTWWSRHVLGLKHVHPLAFVHLRADVRTDLVAEEYAFVSMDCLVMRRVKLCRYAMLAPRVAIVGADHRHDVPGTPMFFSERPETPETVIEADVWVGFGSIVMQGVRVGRGSVVAAGSVVTKDVPPYEIWGGVPARKLRDRFANPADREAHDRMLSGPVLEPRFPSHR